MQSLSQYAGKPAWIIVSGISTSSFLMLLKGFQLLVAHLCLHLVHTSSCADHDSVGIYQYQLCAFASASASALLYASLCTLQSDCFALHVKQACQKRLHTVTFPPCVDHFTQAVHIVQVAYAVSRVIGQLFVVYRTDSYAGPLSS